MSNGHDGDGDTTVETEVSGGLELLDGSGALEAVDRAQIDVQVATAKQHPRSVDKSLKQAETLATLDEETAASMFYMLPRGGKKIEGPSARLAEVMAYSWGNLRADADIVAEDRTHVTAMGTCFDLEKNVAVRVRVKRRITDRHGNRYNEDMIGVTSNAAISIALRNAVFKVIPAALVQRVYKKARRASIGEAGTIEQKRQNALAWFSKLGVTEEQIFRLLEVGGMADIGEDALITLRGLRTALQEGETTVEQAFDRPSGAAGADDLNEEIRKKREESEEAILEARTEQLANLVGRAKNAKGVTRPDYEEYELALADAVDGKLSASEVGDAIQGISLLLVDADVLDEQPAMV